MKKYHSIIGNQYKCESGCVCVETFHCYISKTNLYGKRIIQNIGGAKTTYRLDQKRSTTNSSTARAPNPTTSFHQILTACDEEKEGSFQQSEVEQLRSALGVAPLVQSFRHQSSKCPPLGTWDATLCAVDTRCTNSCNTLPDFDIF